MLAHDIYVCRISAGNNLRHGQWDTQTSTVVGGTAGGPETADCDPTRLQVFCRVPGKKLVSFPLDQMYQFVIVAHFTVPLETLVVSVQLEVSTTTREATGDHVIGDGTLVGVVPVCHLEMEGIAVLTGQLDPAGRRGRRVC